MPNRRITIIDHEINNLASIQNACKALGMDVVLAKTGDDLAHASHVLLPGVGAFGASMEKLHERGLTDAIRQHVDNNRPFLGICLGFQVLFQQGSEGGHHDGVGLFQGSVDRFESKLHVPHVGWNGIDIQQEHPLFDGIASGTHMYFVHSYHPRNVDSADVIACADYGENFVCAVAKGSAAGTQFHPEKSGADGLRLLNNFMNWRP